MLKTTGPKVEGTNRLRLIPNDLVALKATLDNLMVPADNRRLVLCTDHVNDLLLVDQSFKEQYNIDRNTGKIGKLYGFDIYEYANNPIYTTAGAKKHWQQSRKLGNFNVLLLSIQSVYSRLPGAPACILVKLLLIRNTSVI